MFQSLKISLLLFFVNCFDDGLSKQCRPLNQQRQGFRLVLRYPPGWCVSMPRDECDGPADWIIQGFWPTPIIAHDDHSTTRFNHHRNRLQFCCHKQQFNEKKLASIIEQLKIYWPSESYTNHHEYWQQQWNRYGACSHDPTAINRPLSRIHNYDQIDVAEYFALALDLFRRIHIRKWLDDNHLTPSNNHTIQTNRIRETLNSHLNQMDQSSMVYQLRCAHGGNNDIVIPKTRRRNILNEIRFCFDDRLEMIDCAKFADTDQHTGRTGICDDDHVYYVDKSGWP
ncbi:Ribonuclease T2 [Dermatophagoides farinae]|uniref:Ribonuclease T2 n=1 Tax=Dermatophagoides farinae TaxID=6954 RepID=A0A922I9C0_DERFA|nr:Ribonuclease T2 [Dermatophagoides farinae]